MSIDRTFRLRNANIVDVVNGMILADREILVRDGVIAEIDGARSASGAMPSHDARGRFVLPGLIDCHCHVLQGSSSCRRNM